MSRTLLMDNSLLSNPNIKEIHNNLLAKLINGHVGHKENSDSYVSWKMQFRIFCDLPTQQNCSVLENVFYLENKGLLDVGKYDVLQKIFSEDFEALSEIERVSKIIKNIDPSTIRSTDTNFYIVEIRIKVKNGCPSIEEILTGILSEFVWKLDYTYFSSKLDDFQKLSLSHATTICQRIMDGIERSEKYKNFANIISETKSALKKFISVHNKDAEKSSTVIVRQFLNFLDRMKKKYCIQKCRVDWKEYTVIFVELKNVFDFKTCLESASLKKEARSTFENIFSHFNDVRHYAPYVEIREVELHNK